MSATTAATPQLVNNRLIMDSAAAAASSNMATANSTCNACYSRLLELKRQSMKSMMIEYHKMIVGAGAPTLDSLLHIVYQNLHLNEQFLAGTVNGNCTYCGVHIEYLKKHALLALQTANFAPFVTRNMIPQTQEFQPHSDVSTGRPIASHGESSDSINGRRVLGINNTVDYGRDPSSLHDAKRTRTEPPVRSPASPTPAQFFAEAAKKFNIPSKKKSSSKKSPRNRSDDTDFFPTNFSQLLRDSPPRNPPGLFKYMGRRVDGKVSVMLRISRNSGAEQKDSFIEVDQRRKQISILQPKNLENVPQKLQSVNNGPKLYAFDAIFEPEITQNRVSSTALLDVLHAVINGGEGCLLTYGASRSGKTSTMVGNDDSVQTLGLMPSAVSWLYSLIEDCKQRTGARISVRVSAVEVVGQSELLKDLLSEQASGCDSADSTGASPGIYLREDPVGGGVQLGNVSEPQAASGEKAAFYLDAALASRTTEKDSSGRAPTSHMIFTIHIYQYRVEKSHRRATGGTTPYSGGRSRLHLIDLSYVNSNFEQTQKSGAPSHLGLGQIIVAMLNGFKSLPYRDSKITRLLKDSIGNPTCRTTLVAHVSSEEKNYSKTCATINTASKIHRSRRRRNKHCSSSSDNNSCDEGRRRRPNPAMVKTYGIDDNCVSSDYNTSSAGEDSCDTVIYIGANGQLSDRDLSDNERPPSPGTFRDMKLKLASSSEDEMPEPLKLTSSSEEEISNPVFVTSVKESNDIIDKKINTIEEDDKELPTTPIYKDMMNSPFKEKAVNVVAPLVIKKELSNSDSNRTTSPSTEDTKTSLINQLIENRNANDVVLIPNSHGQDDLSGKIPSEKELRKREKRIAKLLKESINGDISSSVNMKNNKNVFKNYDGYTSDVCKSIIESEKKTKCDGYISAPENNFRCKPVQIVKGTVRQQSLDSADIEAKKKTDFNINARELLKDYVRHKLLHQASLNEQETCLDEIGTPVVGVGTPVDCVGTSVDAPIVASTNIPESCVDGPLVSDSSSTLQESSVDPPDSNDTVQERIVEVPPSSNLLNNSNSIHDEASMNIDEGQNGNEILKIQNLNHVITVSSIPDFSVAKKPPLNQLVSSPNIRQHFTRTASVTNTKGYKGSTTSLDLESPRTPVFQRSYSREDTISLVSANESDAYDSDTYCSSYAASPATNRRHHRPIRLRYRWSTVYEEEENMKDNKSDKQANNNKTKKKDIIVDCEPKPARVIGSPKKSIKSPKNEKKLPSQSPKANKKFQLTSKSEPILSPKQKKKFNFLSPKSERKSKKNNSSDKRMSGCSDASSGIGSSSSQSQTPSLHSREELEMDELPLSEKSSPSRSRLWPFSRKSRKSRNSAGYVSDGNLTDSSARSSRRSWLFGSRSKSSLYHDGHSSGYDTVTDGGMTSCAEDLTDNESVSGKKKRRFLGAFQRRSTNDLNSTRGRVKKPMWLDSRRCQSDDEGVQIKVYEIDGPRQMNQRRCKSEDAMGSKSQSKRIEELRKHREHLKNSPNISSRQDEQNYAVELDKENGAIGRRLKVLKNHIQVVTCFDGSQQSRKVTRI